MRVNSFFLFFSFFSTTVHNWQFLWFHGNIARKNRRRAVSYDFCALMIHSKASNLLQYMKIHWYCRLKKSHLFIHRICNYIILHIFVSFFSICHLSLFRYRNTTEYFSVAWNLREEPGLFWEAARRSCTIELDNDTLHILFIKGKQACIWM